MAVDARGSGRIRTARLRPGRARPAAGVSLTGRQRLLTLLYAPAVSLLLAVALSAWVTGIAPARFLLDPALLAETHPLLGVVSNLGVLLWTAAAAINLFSAALLRRRGEDREHWSFLLAAGLLTSWLMLDDLFLIHEWLLPVVLGVPQSLVLATYAMLAAAFLLRFAALILRQELLLLALALAFFTLSVALDQLPRDWFHAWNWLYLLEDGAKLLGIVGWSGYFVRICQTFLERPVRTSEVRDPPLLHSRQQPG